MSSRKQREISQRHELILDKSRELFIRHGYHCVTMDMIAKEMEYSKGTIYQHFDCKECIITSLCTRFCTLVYKLFHCVEQQTQLNPRLQMLLILEAFIQLQEICQDDVQIKNLADSQPFSTKVAVELIDQSCQMERQTFAIVIGIVNRAIDNQQLKLKGKSTAEDVAIGCWALAHGISTLIQNKGCSNTFVFPSLGDLLRINSQLYLDGVGWDSYSLSEKRLQFITEFSEKFKLIIDEYYPQTQISQESTR